MNVSIANQFERNENGEKEEEKTVNALNHSVICLYYTFHFHPPNFIFTEKYQYSISLNDIVARTSLAAGTYHTWKKKTLAILFAFE